MCLLHGATGIVVTLIQLALIKPLEQVFANAGDIIVGNFTQNIENEITTAIGIDSAAYATALNKSLDDTTATVNNDLFGFAKTAADAVNITTVQFYTRFKNGVHSTFDGTAFAAPVIEFLLCVVGGKVFERARERPDVAETNLAPDVLMLGTGNVSEVANPVTTGSCDGQRHCGR